MSVLKIGKVRPTYKGDWNAEVAYEPLDWVLYRGVAYQALGDVPVNREPDVNPDYWVQTGMKGDKGDKGEPGERGPAGVDGRDGAEGAQGAMGPMPGHQWDGGKLAFQNPDGTFAAPVDLQGPQGVQGPEGPVGPQGIPGPAGAQGPAGPQGVKGDTGATPALNNTVTSTSTTQAATANAVKTAYDKAVEAFNKAAGLVLSWTSITDKPTTFAPSAHKASHKTDGTDALTPADIGALAANGKAASAATADTATVAAKLGRNGDTGVPMTFNWSGQGGQPTWLWGSNDGTTHQVYNPANFSVAYAASAGSAAAYAMPNCWGGAARDSIPAGGTWRVCYANVESPNNHYRDLPGGTKCYPALGHYNAVTIYVAIRIA